MADSITRMAESVADPSKFITNDAGDPVTLTVMVFARPDGKVVMATFGSYL